MSGQVTELIERLEAEIAEQKQIIEDLNIEAQKYREYILKLENEIEQKLTEEQYEARIDMLKARITELEKQNAHYELLINKERKELEKENAEWKKLEHWRLFELYKEAHSGDFQHLTKDNQHYSREELFKLAFTLGCAVRGKAEHVENLTYKSFEWLM